MTVVLDDDKEKEKAFKQYAMNLAIHPEGLCTTCHKGKRRFFCYSPSMHSVAYLCKDCYEAYGKETVVEE